MPGPTKLFRLYQVASALALPFIARHAVRQLMKAGQPALRAHERLGHATVHRGLGPLIWFHAPSEAEVRSCLPLLNHIHDTAPSVQLLLTSATAASMQIISGRLPARAAHQFAPFDGVGPLQRFLRHWRPDLSVLVASELWPNLLDQCARADIPVALLDARLSEANAQGWQRYPDTAAHVLRAVTWAHCHDTQTRDHLRRMGLKCAHSGHDLRSSAPVPPETTQLGNVVRGQFSGRPVWLAALTQPGEEDIILQTHKTLLINHPGLCLILAPQQAEQSGTVAASIRAAGLKLAQYKTDSAPYRDAEVCLVDTINDMRPWYDLSPIVFMGGTFSNAGGDTLMSPAAGHTALVHGPHYGAHAEVYSAFQLADAAAEVADGEALTETLQMLLTHPSRAAQLAQNAKALSRERHAPLPALAHSLLSLLLQTTNW